MWQSATKMEGVPARFFHALIGQQKENVMRSIPKRNQYFRFYARLNQSWFQNMRTVSETSGTGIEQWSEKQLLFVRSIHATLLFYFRLQNRHK